MAETQNVQSQLEQYPDYVQGLPEGHPVKNYFREGFHLQTILRELEDLDVQKDVQLFYNLFNQLCEVEKRYARKENQLFPYLEKRGWNGPSQGMWSFHDFNRGLLRSVRKKIDSKDFSHLNQDMREIISEMRRLAAVEEMRLFPISLQILTEEDWKEMSVGEREIGWMLPGEPTSYEASSATGIPTAPPADKRLRMEEGAMTLEQVNLLLRHVPVDLTYVDENDRVIFYNRGEDRVFPRSAGVIGREVRFCHPPKSVGTVLRILEEFRAGTKNEAEFWINYRGRMIHIRYFAIRDKDQTYRGVVEMSQDVTEIKKLEGECRLLNWDASV